MEYEMMNRLHRSFEEYVNKRTSGETTLVKTVSGMFQMYSIFTTNRKLDEDGFLRRWDFRIFS